MKGEKKGIVFIKIGGSVITDKTKPYSLKKSNLKKIVKKIKELYKKSKDLKLFILGHGSGSFGHYDASLYQKNPTILRAARIRYSTLKLHEIVYEELIKNNLPVFSFSPSSFVLSRDKDVSTLNLESFFVCLREGFIPLVYGDVIMDKKLGVTIYSTEYIFRIIASELLRRGFNIEEIIMISGEDGVYDKEGNLMRNLKWGDIKRVVFFKEEGFDVTGGIKAKVIELLNLAKSGIRGIIISSKNFCKQEFSLGSCKEVRCTIIDSR